MTEQKPASLWWIAFFVSVSVSILTTIIIIALVFLVGMVSPDFYIDQWAMTTTGLIVMNILTFVVMWISIMHQARYASKRYLITDYRKAVLYTTIGFVLLTILGFVLDFWQGYELFWEDYALAVLGIVIAYIATRQYLRP